MYLVRQNFTAGEISPRMGARFDMKKYHNSCKTLINAYSLPQGPVMRRTGFEYIAAVKDSTKETRLVPFEFSEEQAYIIEFGNLYCRFYKDGGQIVKTSATAWLTSTTYAVDDWVEMVDGAAPWATSTSYVIDDYVTQDGDIYICLEDHTSGTFSTDLAADKWVEVTGTLYICETAHTSGTFATDLAAGKWTAQTAYEITTTYTEAELPDLKFCQSADTLFIVHADHQPATLTRTAHTSWTLADIEFEVEPSVFNYNGYTLDASGTSGSITLTASTGFFTAAYVGAKFFLHNGMCVVTGYTSATEVDATVTAQKTTANYWATATDYVVGDWVMETTTIYKCIEAHTSGTFSTDLSASKWIADGNLSAHTATADWEEGEWSDRRGYPTCVNFFEQRLCFAATGYAPQTIWMSKSADYYNFGISSPLADDDACTYTISSDQVNVIKWLSPTGVLAIGTTGGEWILSGGNNDVVTPTSVKVVRQSTHGSQALQPVMVGSVHLFLQRPGKIVREFRYSFEMDTFDSIDLSIISEHLTRSSIITDWAYQQTPNSILWCVRADGVLLGLTYLRQHEVIGWHKHVTDGEFESVAVIPGDTEDELWSIIKRTIDGSDVRYIERMYPEFNPSSTDPTDGFFVDSGLTYDGTSTTSISGLDHLEGETVVILGDGAVQPSKTVASGAITLQNAVEKAHIGLAYNTDVEPMPIELVSDDVTSMGRMKSVVKAHISFVDSSGLSIGTSFDTMRPVIFRQVTDNLGEYVPLYTGIKSQTVPNSYDKTATICMRQSSPLPMTVRGVTYEVEVNN